MMDLFIGYDHHTLAEQSHDLTTFQTPLGMLCLTVLPQGWTDSPAVFQNDMAFILQHKIDISLNFQDDINVLGPHTCYNLLDGTFETTTNNPGIQCFMWEHCNDVNRILHCLKHARATVSVKKLFMCQSEVIVIGQTCTYKGHIPNVTKVSKIPEVHGFLSTTGTVRIWIKDFAATSHPLVHLIRNNIPFVWGEQEQAAMDTLKSAIATSPAIRLLDYSSINEVILMVNSSHIAARYILSQMDNNRRCHPAHFSLIMWNKHKSHYSQAKLELYGLFCMLKAVKVWIISVKNFTVEVDAQYVKGMLNNPNIQPNASMNHWLTSIQTFNFKLWHVSATKHEGPDGLSRRRRGEDKDRDEEGEEEVEQWIDEVLRCSIWIAGEMGTDEGKLSAFSIGKGKEDKTRNKEIELPNNDDTCKRDQDLWLVNKYLWDLHLPTSLPEKERTQLSRYSRNFFMHVQSTLAIRQDQTRPEGCIQLRTYQHPL